MDGVSGSHEIVTKSAEGSVQETVAKLVEILSSKNLKLFTVIDQSKEASEVGLVLRETVLVVFGDPKAGTPVMAASPLSALDLPLKILVWSDDGRTKVSYESPRSLAARHDLQGELATTFDGIDVLTDVLVGST
jgi:uncharacterized protein (DUF302 family)